MTDSKLARVASLSEYEAELVLQTALDKMLEAVPDPAADSEDGAREIIASAVSDHSSSESVQPQDVVPYAADPAKYVGNMLLLLANDPETSGFVADAISELDKEDENEQLFVEPITAALILTTVVVFLQTKFTLDVDRKNGTTNVKMSISKDATGDDLISKVIASVRASLGL